MTGDLVPIPTTVEPVREPMNRRGMDVIVHTFGPDLRYLGPVRVRTTRSDHGFEFAIPREVRVDGDLVRVEAISPYPPTDPRFRVVPLDAHARTSRLDLA